jgi:cation:H+ antiporter
MAIDVAFLFLALLVILLSAELFTNGVEWLGQRLNLSQGVVGSVLAAVGTALPETLIPFVAVIFFGGAQGHDVGIGAIAGAPFMLSTLTLCLCGISMWFFARRGRRPTELKISRGILSRDLRFFILAYSLGLTGTFIDIPIMRWIIAACLVLLYPLYLYKTFQHEGEVGEAPEKFHMAFCVRPGCEPSLRLIAAQAVLGLAGIIVGAFLFVHYTQDVAHLLGVPALILSLIIAPIATELPEKVNSILWARTGKDTLALGNITGALVFQSCFPVAFGVAFTHWELAPHTVATGVIAIASASLYLLLISKGKLRPIALMSGGVVYAMTISALIFLGVTEH